MALTKLTTNLNNIQALHDRPNVTDGLTADELKERFDKAGNDMNKSIELGTEHCILKKIFKTANRINSNFLNL